MLPALLAAADGPLVITLLGTGGPELTPERSGIATLIEVNGESLLFDAGRGALDQIYAARVPPQNVTKIFLTHLHNDHTEGLATLWLTPWFLLGRKANLRIWGPPGTKDMIQGMRQMYNHDLDRRSNETFKREYLDLDVHEVNYEMHDGVVYSENGVQVTAIPVEHRDGNPALAYRVNAGGRSVLLTGDTTLTPSLLMAGKGVDVLISNVAAGSAEREASGAIEPILEKLIRPEQAAKLFAESSPRLAVFSHIVKKGLPGKAGDRTILQRTRRAGYTGPLKMGLDGMKITVAEKIRVSPPAGRKGLPDFDGPASKY